MAEYVRKIRIFVASPGDVQKEREALDKGVRKLDRTLGKERGLSLELLRWETHAYPAAGDPQTAINKQIGTYDLFVGIFWQRFGTPTTTAGSGTEEEYQRAYASWTEHKRPPILLYFCDRAYTHKNAEELEQAARVMRFRESLKGRGLWWPYRGVKQFSELAEEHLYKAILELLGDGEVVPGLAHRRGVSRDPGIHVVQEIQNNAGTTIGVVTNYHEAPKPLPTPLPDDGPRRRYLDHLRHVCRLLPLAAAGAKDSDEEAVSLDDVYIGLNTTTGEEAESKERGKKGDEGAERKPLSAMAVVAKYPRLVLLGDPGSGKSTFVNQLLALQADRLLDEKIELLAGVDRSLLPVRVILRDMAVFVRRTHPNGLPPHLTEEELARLVKECVVSMLARQDAEDFQDAMKAVFTSGQLLLVLDGLDEVPYGQRDDMRRLVRAFMRQRPPARLIITCRVRSYQDEAKVISKCHTTTLAPFNDEQKTKFAGAWYEQVREKTLMDEETARGKAKALARAATSEELSELAENPLLLTTMALIHQRDIGLPERRAELYKVAIDVLLWKWQKRKTEEEIPVSGLLASLLKDDRRIQRTMMRLAYEAHQPRKDSAEQDVAGLPRGEALTILERKDYLTSTDIAAEFLDYVDQRSGLLHGQGGADSDEHPLVYGFPHRTFQEYLAGCHLMVQPASDVLPERAREGDFWYEALKLGLEDLVYNRQGEQTLLRDAYLLCPDNWPADLSAQRVILWTGYIADLIGIDVIEADERSEFGGKAFLSRLKRHLVALIGSGLPALERAEAGRLLGRLGDPRPGILTLHDMPFCFVPKGPFLMGSDKDDEMAWDDEKPRCEIDIDYDIWIARYPVTNAQYAQFLNDGYQNRQWWTEAGWEEKGLRTGPDTYRDVFQLPNHPVVGVSWYEALAYSRWLDTHAHAQGWLPRAWHIKLPNEPEWEKAARGGLEIPLSPCIEMLCGLSNPNRAMPGNPNPMAARRYPWGRDPDPNAMNFNNNIRRTTAPGCFPAGQSVYGAMDMSGNVLEWTRSQWANPKPRDLPAWKPLDTPEGSPRRVWRGGSFVNYVRNCRCAYRDGNDPSGRSYRLGFRLALLPFPDL